MVFYFARSISCKIEVIIKTINLNQDWKMIYNDLIDLLEHV
jgi:hypothetical protein